MTLTGRSSIHSKLFCVALWGYSLCDMNHSRLIGLLEIGREFVMAKMNKTALVKEYLESNPEAGPTEVAQALKSHKIAPGYVSNIKMKMKKASYPTASDNTVVAAARFIKACGGIKQARKALETAQAVASELNE